MFDTNSLFSSSTTTAFDFGDILNSFVSNKKESTQESTQEYDWKKAYLSLKDDFDSYRKRIENTRQSEKKNLTKEIVKGFLEVVEYTLFTYNAKNKMGTYSKEDEMILNKLSNFLKTYDVYPMKDPTGHPFDHNFHEAVLSDESGMFKPGTVTMVLSHGYMFGDEVLKHARVVVAK